MSVAPVPVSAPVSAAPSCDNRGLEARDLSLYIHFPYCERKCPYCDFNAHASARIPEEAYVAAVLWRLQNLSGDETTRSASRLLRSIFFGGGTPSLLSPRAVDTILEGVNRQFRLAEDCEITMEANPSDTTRGMLASWRKAGVNRISLGVQSFDDDALRFLGRVHDARQAQTACADAARMFALCSFDLITALPLQSDKAVQRELSQATAFATSHLCVYQLTIEKATAFYHAHARGAFSIPSPSRAARLYGLVEETLAAQGYANYEISSYARTNAAQSRHNLVYWRSGDWLGVGPGAHGRLTHKGQRIATLETRDPNRWIRQAHAHDTRVEKRTLLSAQEALHERVMMGLRLAEGLPMALFAEAALARIDDLCKVGYCDNTAQRLNLTKKGRLRLNAIAADLLLELSSACNKRFSADTDGNNSSKENVEGQLDRHLATYGTA